MKILFDLFPVVLFFVSFKLAHAFPTQATALAANTLGLAFASPLIPEQIPIVLATVIAIGATIAQVGVLVALKKKIEPMVWISLAIIVIFGGATVYLQDETFIKWKPTILYWAFAGILAVGAVFLKKNFVRLLLGQSIQLPDPVWTQLGWAWTVFFLFAGAINVMVAYTVSTEIWVDFKLFGLLGLTLAFSLAIGLWLSRHMQPGPVGKDASDAS